ncbi:filamentous hemagglutinin N-terminal domain-containing protein [Pleurocapsa sp. PCC 7319]|uniref:two-partner secretion domain-containing protein n=1 Tax=Pleurocapsa sp. PCC 7319 TaxID=118161 RepID=UPI000347B974|nr:filamentous hemagglutinin N-terminal domain-containing protein [Pleurocapsa sp. PCC 7319]
MKCTTWLSFPLAALSYLIPLTAEAQVTPDGTTSTTVNQNGNDFTIEQGDRAGDNLFHSFDEFSVPTGGSAAFNNAANIANIFSRVTGSNISDIDGLISANGAANLFLINPNGIIFGQNASLNLGGSFFASTADSLLFEGDTEFSASNPQALPLLEVSIPIGLNFRDNPGDITVQSNNDSLMLPTEETITFVGGNVTFDGADIVVPGSNVELGGLTEAGTVTITEESSLSFLENIAQANISFQNNSRIYVAGSGGGFITINGENLEIIEGSSLIAGIAPGSINSEAQAGNVTTNINNDITLSDNSFILNAVSPNATGNGGDLNITTNSLSVNNSQISTTTLGDGDSGNINISANSLNVVNGTGINSSTLGDGNGGDITIVAEEEVRIAGANDSPLSVMGFTFSRTPSLLNNAIGVGSDGNGGNINISAGNLTIEDGAQITTSNAGNGIGGDINLDIRGDILLQGRTPVQINDLDFNFLSIIQTAAGGELTFGIETSGQAGSINIQANSLRLNDASVITSFTGTNQNAGDILIRTEEVIALDSGSIDSSVLPLAEGMGGNIDIETKVLNLTAGGRIDSQVNGNFLDNPGGIGQGGNIRIDASESVNISGFRAASEEPVIFNPLDPTQTELVGLDSSGIFVSAQTGALGKAGIVTLNTGELNLLDSGIIEAITANSSDAGDIEVNVNTLNAIDGGQIIATTFSEGKAGNIIINSNNAINLSGSDPTLAQRLAQRPDVIRNQGTDSGIFANTTEDSTGNGGSIFILNPEQLTIQDGAEISVNSLGQGSGGDLSVQTDVLSLNQGEVSASTESGTGGNITLQVNQDLLLRNDSTISARAANDANGGNANINSELVIAFPDGNNDIIANAESGNGGNINITTESLFGIEERPLNPFTNDINASSQFNIDGNIVINTPEVDPTSGLLELPEAVSDASDQISQNPCEQGRGSEFLITGKGGFPANPQETLNSGRVKVDLIEPVSSQQQIQKSDNTYFEPSTSEPVPAQGWVFNEEGKVIFTAYSTRDTPTKRSEQQHHTTCSSGI